LIAIDTLGSLQLAVPGLEVDLLPVRLDPPGDLVARIPAWNDAMLRIWCDPQPGNGSMISCFYRITVPGSRRKRRPLAHASSVR